MYDRISTKIKLLAQVICWIGIGISVIIGIKMLDEAIYWEDGELVLSAFGIMIIGSLLSWAGSFFTYGFGEIIEKLSSVQDYVRKTEENKVDGKKADKYVYYDKDGNVSETPTANRVLKEELKKKEVSVDLPKDFTWKCPKCGCLNRDANLVCMNCREER